jgi:hypothetical protein
MRLTTSASSSIVVPSSGRSAPALALLALATAEVEKKTKNKNHPPADHDALPPPSKTQKIGVGGRQPDRPHTPWSLAEAEALVEGVAQCGVGKWENIKRLGCAAILSHRTAVAGQCKLTPPGTRSLKGPIAPIA